MPRLWNKRDPACPPDAYYIGRPSDYGNKYSHLPHAQAIKVDSREEAVEKHAQSVDKDIAFIPEYRDKIKNDLAGKDLVCWCAPFGGMEFTDPRKLCHGQYLGQIANE